MLQAGARLSPLLWRPVERSLSAFNVAAACPLREHGRDEGTAAPAGGEDPAPLQLATHTDPTSSGQRGDDGSAGHRHASPASRRTHTGCPGPSWSSLPSHLPRALQIYPKIHPHCRSPCCLVETGSGLEPHRRAYMQPAKESLQPQTFTDPLLPRSRRNKGKAGFIHSGLGRKMQ